LPRCIPREACTTDDKGAFVEVRYLFLKHILIPAEVEQNNLKALVLTEENEREFYVQQEAIITKETEQKVGEDVCVIAIDVNL